MAMGLGVRLIGGALLLLAKRKVDALGWPFVPHCIPTFSGWDAEGDWSFWGSDSDFLFFLLSFGSLGTGVATEECNGAAGTGTTVGTRRDGTAEKQIDRICGFGFGFRPIAIASGSCCTLPYIRGWRSFFFCFLDLFSVFWVWLCSVALCCVWEGGPVYGGGDVMGGRQDEDETPLALVAWWRGVATVWDAVVEKEGPHASDVRNSGGAGVGAVSLALFLYLETRANPRFTVAGPVRPASSQGHHSHHSRAPSVTSTSMTSSSSLSNTLNTTTSTTALAALSSHHTGSLPTLQGYRQGQGLPHHTPTLPNIQGQHEPPPPLVTMHRHAQRVSVSPGMAMGLGVGSIGGAPPPLPPPVRKASEATVGADTLVAPARPFVVDALGRPFVPPPPLVPIIPIVSAQRMGAGGRARLGAHTHTYEYGEREHGEGESSTESDDDAAAWDGVSEAGARQGQQDQTVSPLLSMSTVLRSCAAVYGPAPAMSSSTTSSTPSSARWAPPGISWWCSGERGEQREPNDVCHDTSYIVRGDVRQRQAVSLKAVAILALEQGERRRLRLHSPVDMDVPFDIAEGGGAAGCGCGCTS
ncbi:hypothetical protein K438DRAFT_1770569 [Mycena galopus ATCC 62051]|nr:hypothetical protein K438DRAFT_1770569 [Mycena galopus ATCC 62051]